MNEIKKSLKKRFGENKFSNPRESVLINQLCKRSTCRSFINRPLENDLLEYLLSISQSSSTSGMLQTYSVLSLESDKEKDKLLNDPKIVDILGRQDSWNVSAIKNCSAFLIWIADLHRIEFILQDLYTNKKIDIEILNQVTRAEYHLKAIVDTTILAQSFSLCAESLGLGIMYCGAARLIPATFFEQNFNLPKLTFPIFGMAVGYPAQNRYNPIKPRMPTDMILHRGNYKRIQTMSDFDNYNKLHLKLLRTDSAEERTFIDRVIERLKVGPAKLSVSDSLKNMKFNFN
jgi:nitroreductase